MERNRKICFEEPRMYDWNFELAEKTTIIEKAGKIREKLAEEGADYLEKAVAAAEEDIASLKWNAGKKTEEVINKVISELI